MVLFTVLIAEKEHIDAMRQGNKLFFEPFLDNKELAFCYWNPMGQNLYDSVPELQDTVGRRKDWRAVIINSSTKDSIKKRNPFDVVDYSAINSMIFPNRQPESDESWENWEAEWKTYFDRLTVEKKSVFENALEHPLQKLTTWLCFQPEDYILNEVQAKKDVQDWAMEKIGRDDEKASAKLEHMEHAQYKREIRLKEMIRRSFLAESRLNISCPNEVFCISVRTMENSYFNPDSYWNVHQESEYSTFLDRNMYFDKTRFMVFELLPKEHRNFRTDYIRFLASILIFISNPVPGSAMKARYLYQLEVKTDDTPLCTLITSYDKKLSATMDVIENEMEAIRSEIPDELSDKAAEALFCSPTDVAVPLDPSCNPEKIYVDRDYGFFLDSPENEFHKWSRAYTASKSAVAYILKQRARSVRKGVSRLHLSSDNNDVKISRLTDLQMDDIQDYTNNAEDEMVATIPRDIMDTSCYTERMDIEAEKIKKVINTRMTKNTALTLGGMCLVLFFISFLPFLLSNGSTQKNMSTSMVICFAALGTLVISMLISLLFLRATLRRALKSYNNTAAEIMDEILGYLKQVSKYLSATCNVCRGHAVQNYAQRNLDEYTKRLRIRKKHREDIRKRRAYLAEDYGDYFGDRSLCDVTMSRPYDYDYDQEVEYEYPAPFLAGDCRQIEFICKGNFITVPSSYVKSILIRMEGIYES